MMEYFKKDSNYYIDFSISMAISLAVHTLMLLTLLLFPTKKLRWDITLDFKEKEMVIKLSKAVNMERIKEIIKPKLLKPEDRVIELDKMIKLKSAPKIKNKKVLLTQSRVKKRTVKESNKNINHNPPKVTLSEISNVSKDNYLNIKFNESEVVKGKKMWMGSAVGTSNLRSFMPAKNPSRRFPYETGSRNGYDSYGSDTTQIQLASNGLNDEKIYEAFEIDSIPKTVFFNPPVYPELARRLGVEGKVLLKLLIDSQGRVKGINPIGKPSNVGFEESAIAAVRSWTFTIPTVNNNPVSIWFILPLEFKLQ